MDGIIDSPSPNYDERDQAISMVVLHYTGMRTPNRRSPGCAIPRRAVSCHYLIAEDGQILRMVAEENRAWHAGLSYWRGVPDVNGCSDRHRDRQSGPRIRLPPVHRGADGGAAAAARRRSSTRYRIAPRQRRRPFRRRAGAQGGSGRTVRLGAARPARARHCPADPQPRRSALDRRRLPARARALGL